MVRTSPTASPFSLVTTFKKYKCTLWDPPYLVVESHFHWKRSSHGLMKHFYPLTLIQPSPETLGAKFIIAIKTFFCVKTLVKFRFKITFPASIILLSLDHCFKNIYWQLPDQRQIVFFVILFPAFRIFALFTSYFLCLPRGSMWGWTAVEIYIFLVLTPEEGLTPSPYGVL